MGRTTNDSTEGVLGWSYIDEIITQDVIDPINGNRLLSKGTKITGEKESYLIEEMGCDADELPNILRPYFEEPKTLSGGTPHVCGVPPVIARHGDGNSVHFCPRCYHIEKYPLFYYRNQLDQLEYVVVDTESRVEWADIYQQRFKEPKNGTRLEEEMYQTKIQGWEEVMARWTTYYRCSLRELFLTMHDDSNIKCVIRTEDGFTDIVGRVTGYNQKGNSVFEKIITQELVLSTDKGEQKIPDAQIEWVEFF